MIEETEKTPEVFREHFEECWRHFAGRFNAKHPPGSKTIQRFRKVIADFCGVHNETVGRWLSAEKLNVVGDVHLKLKCFLDLNGYRIIEFERLERVLRSTSELIGYGVMRTEEVSAVLGYSRPQNIYPVLRESEGVGSGKESRMFDLWKEKKLELEQAKKKALKRYYMDLSQRPRAVQEMPPAPTPAPFATAAEQGTAGKRSAVLAILESTLVFFEGGLFEGLSENEAASLRERHGSAIMKLTTHLSAFNSRVFGGEGGD